MGEVSRHGKIRKINQRDWRLIAISHLVRRGPFVDGANDRLEH